MHGLEFASPESAEHGGPHLRKPNGIVEARPRTGTIEGLAGHYPLSVRTAYDDSAPPEVRSMAAQLKIYREDAEAAEPQTQDRVAIRLGDLLPLVSAAQRRHFTWLQDFLEDEVAISTDLHDVLMAFRTYRPSA